MSEAWPHDQRRSWPGSAGDRPQAAGDSACAAGDRSRDAILHAAASLATQDGLDGPSAGTLAAALSMSRAGRPAHAASKQELQLATVAEAARIFDEEVMQPALTAPSGLGQLAAVCEAFFAHLERHMVPGGCFMAGAALEMETSPNPVRDLIASFQAQFGELIRGFAATAMARNELPPGEDPDRLAFELNGIMLATDTNFAAHDDPAVLALARQIVRSRLGIRDTGRCTSPGQELATPPLTRSPDRLPAPPRRRSPAVTTKPVSARGVAGARTRTRSVRKGRG